MKPTTDKKLQKFLEEINKLSDKYQYKLKAELSVTPQGIVPRFGVENVPPKENPKKGKK